MKMRKITSYFALAAISFLSANSALALESVWDFKTTPNGRFVGSLRLDEEPGVDCTHELIVKAFIGPTTSESDGSDTTSVRTKTSSSRTVRFRAGNLPAVVKNQQGGIPRVYGFVRTTCNGVVTDSNVTGRFIRCGRGKKKSGLDKSRVTVARFIQQLDKKVR